MTDPCDVSWLRLESYVLGELPASAMATVDHHVQTCPVCRRRLTAIDVDAQIALPPLTRARSRRWVWPTVGVAAAAALALMLLRPSPPAPGEVGPSHTTKGGDLTLSIVREHGGRVQEATTGFRSGDRWQLQLTCPPGVHAYEVWATEDDGADELLTQGHVDCGNRVPIGPTFSVTHAQVITVCAVVDPRAPEPQTRTVCRTLREADEEDDP